MRPTPHPSSTEGLSSQGTVLLALTGAGLAVFLIFLLPRMNASRAAGPHRSSPVAEPAESSKDRAVELAKPATLEPEAAPEVETAAAPSETTEQLEVEAQPKVEGPSLRYLRGVGKPDEVDHRELRAGNRERRKERREAAASAGEQGIAPDKQRAAEAEAERFKSQSNPDRRRLGNNGGTGRGQGQKKGKPRGG